MDESTYIKPAATWREGWIKCAWFPGAKLETIQATYDPYTVLRIEPCICDGVDGVMVRTYLYA